MTNPESWIKRLDLPSKELCILSAQVNEICRLEPGEFLPDKHLPEIRNIIHSLDPCLVFGDRIRGSMIDMGDDDDDTPKREFLGQTETGISIQIPDPKKQPHEVARFGKRDGIGIGSYIAEKEDARKGLVFLCFTPFLDYTEVQIDPRLSKPRRSIVYRKNSLEPVELKKEIPQMHWFIVTYASVPIWQAPSGKLEK